MSNNDKNSLTDIEQVKVQENATKKIFSKSDAEKFAQRGFSQKKFNTGSLRFSKLYQPRHNITRYFIAAAVGIVMSFFSVILVQATGLYTGGFGAICQGIARITYTALNKNHTGSESMRLVVYNLLFWGLYLAINVPLIIFAYKKINKQFAKLSIVYLIAMQGMGFVWGIIPQLQEFKVFGLTNTIYPLLDANKVQVNVFYPHWYPIINGTNDWNIDWSKLYTYNQLGDAANYPTGYPIDPLARRDWIVNYVSGENITNTFLLLLYCCAYAIISSLGYAMVYIIGGSTGGSDFVTIYFSQEKNKNVGLMFIIINLICMSIGITIGSYGAGILTNSTYFSGWEFFFSANLFVSLLFIILNGTLMNKWFPWRKMTRIEIYSNKQNEIIDKFKTVGYTHPITVVSATGGMSGQKRDVLVTICMIVELPNVVHTVRTIDEQCLISSVPINDLDGNFTLQRQTF